MGAIKINRIEGDEEVGVGVGQVGVVGVEVVRKNVMETKERVGEGVVGGEDVKERGRGGEREIKREREGERKKESD